MLDPRAGGRDAVLLAFPLAQLGVPVRQTLVRLVPHDEALVLAVFLEVGLGQQLRLHVDAAIALHQPAFGELGFVVDVEERCVRPATHHGVVIGLVLDDPIEPRQRQRAIGAGTKRQPDIGLFAQRRDARIHHDMLRRAMRDVGDRAVRGVVVGIFARRAPLHVHAGLGLHLHPRGSHLVGHDAAEVARAFAHLVGQMRVRRAEQLFHALIRPERPHARRAAHHEDGLPAVLLLHFLELLAAYLERLVQRDAHPTGIVLALRVRALHRETKAVGMVQRLHRRLRLRTAVPAALRRGLVALHLDDLAVAHGYPNAALHLAAGAAARANALTSPASASTPSASACIGSATAVSDAAAPVTAIAFMKLRRVSVS